MLNTRSVLIAFYALVGLASLYHVGFGGGNYYQLIFLVLSIVSIMALTGNAGSWARITALLFSGFILIVMAYIVFFNVYRLFAESSFAVLPVIIAPILATLAALSVRSLLRSPDQTGV